MKHNPQPEADDRRVLTAPDAGATEVVRSLLARFAASDTSFRVDGVSDWTVSVDTIRFLAAHTPAVGVTLETGAGLSTVLFAALGGRHICVCPDRGEADRILAYCEAEGISTSGLKFLIARSEDALPALDAPPLDLVLIDGGHGFPMPMIDWYYTASKLKLGGVLVIDDTQLWPCALLVNFLKHDSAWTPVGRIGRRTFAFRKVASFEYKEFCFQPYVLRRSRFRSLAARALVAWDLLVAGDAAEFFRRCRKAVNEAR
jgi:predicted O-methyltransferase YrrM